MFNNLSLKSNQDFSIFWFRRDLRLEDNNGLLAALAGPYPVLPVFFFDPEILDKLQGPSDKRIDFIHLQLGRLKATLEQMGSTLYVLKTMPIEGFRSLAEQGNLKEVYTNHDYEPQAIARDQRVIALLEGQEIWFHTFKDQVIFEKNEVLKQDGTPFSVFTPYSKKWLTTYQALNTKQPIPIWKNLLKTNPSTLPSIEDIGFTPSHITFPQADFPKDIIRNYGKTRDLPALATSKLGVHLRFGTISIRSLVSEAFSANSIFLNELIWREFFMSILYHFPRVCTTSFRPEYDRIPWLNDPEDFQRWQEGRTGFPLVDAGMRELSATGFMHNRVRMLTASFLTKDLLIDWRWGEAWFAEKLLDFELSANNGNWEWAAGCGCDAAPYFRIFNPEIQRTKFDPDNEYIRKWVPEFGSRDYPAPMVSHDFARKRCLQTYKIALQS